MKPSPVLFTLQLILVILLLDHHRLAPIGPFLNHKSVCGNRTPSAAVYFDPTLTCSPPIFSLAPWPHIIRLGLAPGLHPDLAPVVLGVPLVLPRVLP